MAPTGYTTSPDVTTPGLTARETPTPRPAPSAAVTRVAGGLALAHVVLMLGGFSLERSTLLGDGVAQARHAYVEGSLTRAMTGGYIEALAFVVLLPVLVYLARAFGRRTEIGHWAAQTGLAAGVGNVAVTLAVGLPAGAAALYGGHHGADLNTALMIVNIRNFAFFLSLLLLGTHAACVGGSTLADKVPSRWIGIGGLAVGALLVVSVAGAGMEWQNYATMVWIVWWVGVAIQLLRNRGVVTADEAR